MLENVSERCLFAWCETTATWAGVVQAVGAVAAIGATWWIAKQTDQRTRMLQQRQEAEISVYNLRLIREAHQDIEHAATGALSALHEMTSAGNLNDLQLMRLAEPALAAAAAKLSQCDVFKLADEGASLLRALRIEVDGSVEDARRLLHLAPNPTARSALDAFLIREKAVASKRNDLLASMKRASGAQDAPGTKPLP